MGTKQELLSNLRTAMSYAIVGNYDMVNFYLKDDFDDNYYGDVSLKFGTMRVELESIWTNDGLVMLHVCCKSFEGDIRLDSVSNGNQQRVITMLINKLSA